MIGFAAAGWSRFSGLAWPLIIVGAVLIVLGTACMMKVRRQMLAEQGTVLGLFVSSLRETSNYLLHDYDQPDRPLMLLAWVGRFFGGVAVVAGGILWFLKGF